MIVTWLEEKKTISSLLSESRSQRPQCEPRRWESLQTGRLGGQRMRRCLEPNTPHAGWEEGLKARVKVHLPAGQWLCSGTSVWIPPYTLPQRLSASVPAGWPVLKQSSGQLTDWRPVRLVGKPRTACLKTPLPPRLNPLVLTCFFLFISSFLFFVCLLQRHSPARSGTRPCWLAAPHKLACRCAVGSGAKHQACLSINQAWPLKGGPMSEYFQTHAHT